MGIFDDIQAAARDHSYNLPDEVRALVHDAYIRGAEHGYEAVHGARVHRPTQKDLVGETVKENAREAALHRYELISKEMFSYCHNTYQKKLSWGNSPQELAILNKFDNELSFIRNSIRDSR